jgi:serine/threonine protein kinase
MEGLVYLHKNNVIHRDIKGGNIMLTRKGDVKIIDFGVSIIICDELKRFSFIGSPHFMAPGKIIKKLISFFFYFFRLKILEVINNKDFPSGYDTKADICISTKFFFFSYFICYVIIFKGGVGIMMIQLAENKVPHHDLQPMVAMRQVVRSTAPKFTNESNWSSEMIDFLAKCLEKKPLERQTEEKLLKVFIFCFYFFFYFYLFLFLFSFSILFCKELIHQILSMI